MLQNCGPILTRSVCTHDWAGLKDQRTYPVTSKITSVVPRAAKMSIWPDPLRATRQKLARAMRSGWSLMFEGADDEGAGVPWGNRFSQPWAAAPVTVTLPTTPAAPAGTEMPPTLAPVISRVIDVPAGTGPAALPGRAGFADPERCSAKYNAYLGPQDDNNG